jgi:hypothetical protein
VQSRRSVNIVIFGERRTRSGMSIALRTRVISSASCDGLHKMSSDDTSDVSKNIIYFFRQSMCELLADNFNAEREFFQFDFAVTGNSVLELE